METNDKISDLKPPSRQPETSTDRALNEESLNDFSKRTPTRVVVGIIWNETLDQVLVSQRHMTKDFGGLWEFPGGKVEALEEDGFALSRELREELDIAINDFEFAFNILHHYPHKSVELLIYNVFSFFGKPRGNEEQQIQWRNVADLMIDDFPKANGQIIDYIQERAGF